MGQQWAEHEQTLKHRHGPDVSGGLYSRICFMSQGSYTFSWPLLSFCPVLKIQDIYLPPGF